MFYSEEEMKNYEKAKLKSEETIQKLEDFYNSLQCLSPENQRQIVCDFRDKVLLQNAPPAIQALYAIFKNF